MQLIKDVVENEEYIKEAKDNEAINKRCSR